MFPYLKIIYDDTFPYLLTPPSFAALSDFPGSSGASVLVLGRLTAGQPGSFLELETMVVSMNNGGVL